LLNRDKHKEAIDYGFSFNSKKVAHGPAFFNLRVICDCLGKAVRRHIDFSEGELWFLDEKNDLKKRRKKEANNLYDELEDPLIESHLSDKTAFSYNFKEELKINSQ
jgi:hypothetical protein